MQNLEDRAAKLVESRGRVAPVKLAHVVRTTALVERLRSALGGDT